jgi:hypothetical protein
LSNAMRFGKRSLAGVAAGALALGMLTIASAPAASAKPSIKPKASLTGTVSPVRSTLVGAQLEAVPFSQITWTASGTTNGTTDTIAVALTTAPSPTAALALGQPSLVGVATTPDTTNAITNATANETLASGATSFALTSAYAAASTARIAIAATQAGTYTGTITTNSNSGCVATTTGQTGGGVCDVISFTFTTTGKAASMTLTPASTSISTSGVAPLVVTLRDSAGNVTQPLTVDTVAVTAPGAASISPASISMVTTGPSPAADSLFDGTAAVSFVASSTPGIYTVTATPAGTLPAGGVTAQSATVSTSGTVSSTAVSTISVSTPTDADNAGTQPSAATAAVPAGTSALTVTVTGTAATTYRLAAFASNLTGTINGATAGTSLGTATAFVNVTTNASGVGTAAFTVGGNLLSNLGAITINQVTAANAALASPGVALLVTQQLSALSPSLSETAPRGNIVQALGTPTPVTVTVVDQFGDPISNATVRAYRSAYLGTLLGSGVTNSSGQAQVTVSNATGLAAGGSETYVFSAAPFGAAEQQITGNTLTILYTASGAVTSMSVSVTGGATTPILNTTTSIATIPYVYVPYTGIVTGQTASVYNQTTGALTGGSIGNYATFSALPNPANMVTVTVPAGVKVSTTVPSATTLWSGGSQSVTAASSQSVYVWATKTGTHDITFTSGAITTTAKIEADTPAAAAYNIAVSPTSRTIETGAFSTVELTVSDVFGNPIPFVTTTAGAAGAVAATASGEVLLSGLTASATLGTGATGKSTVTLIAGNRAGTGKITFAPSGGVTNAAAAWQSGYVKPVGAPDPVKSAEVNVIVTDTPDKSITISGTRGTVSGRSGIIIDGVTDGIENGKTVTPFIRFPGETTFTAGSARPEISADEFTWQRKTGKRVTVYVELSDDASVRSNRVVIQAS